MKDKVVRCVWTDEIITETCEEEECKWWINSCLHCNCTEVAAAEGGLTLEQVGTILGITRERVRQIEKAAMEKLRRSIKAEMLRTLID
jgi:DNA-directed RNA polymerase sigma subunit (sigma70/sigma32)